MPAAPRLLTTAAALVALGCFALVALDGRADETAFQIAFLLYALLGLWVLDRRPGHRVGLLLTLVGGAVLGSAALDVVARAQDDEWARWGQAWLYMLGWNLGTSLLLHLLPEGRPLSPRWGAWAWVVGGAAVLEAAVVAVRPGRIGSDSSLTNPIGLDGVARQLEIADALLLSVVVAGTLTGVVSLVLRWRRADARERRQVAWLLLGMLVALGLLGSAMVIDSATGPGAAVALLVSAALTAPAVAIVVAILREQLFDIRFVVTRTIVFGAFVAGSVVVYAATLAIASTWLTADQDVAVAVLAGGVVMALLTSVQARVHRLVERALFGEARRPYDVLRRLSSIAERHGNRTAELEALVAETLRSLRLPWVAVIDLDGAVLAGSRQPGGRSESFPMTHGGRALGSLEVGRGGSEELRPEELELLEAVAAQMAASVWAAGALEELTAARTGLVRSREDERTRIRRDLHDGVGPLLAAATLQVDAISRRLDADDQSGRDLAVRVKEELQDAVADIRSLLDGLRPPALDRGVATALAESAGALRDAGIDVAVEIPRLPPLEPAVEVACYRIATEGLTNVLKHSGASRARLSVTPTDDGSVIVEVADDGRGLGPEDATRGGLGLESMRLRARELGGTFEVGVGDDAAVGLTVRATLPGGAR